MFLLPGTDVQIVDKRALFIHSWFVPCPVWLQVGFKPTGRMCTKPGCKGHLVDHILDWEDPLPPAELKATEQHTSAAVSNTHQTTDTP